MTRSPSLGLPFIIMASLLLTGCGDDEPDQAATGPEVAAQGEVPFAAAPSPAAVPPQVVTAPGLAAVDVPAPVAAEAPPPALEPALVPLPADQDAVPDATGNYVGIAEAVEGDVIRLGRTRFLLYGIDTVEGPQFCAINGQMWECWAATVRQLQTIIAEGPVTCTPAGPPDIYGRILALCEVNSESVNARMVRSGFALVFADEMPEYLPLQEAAQEEMIGLWQGTFQLPQEYRESVGRSDRRP